MFVQSKVHLKYILITCDLFWGRIPLPSLQGRDLAGIYLPRGRSGMHARGDKWEDDMVDSDFASSDSESNASSTDEEDQVDNPGWQEDAGIRKRDTLGQWDEIYKVEVYPIVRAAGAPTNKANLNDISYSGRALDGSNPWAPFVNAKDYDLAK